MQAIVMYAGYVLTGFGVLFLLFGALGILRMPDVYNRMQAGTKATTLGAVGTIMGVGLINPEWFFKTLIIALFILLSNTISSHALARGSYRSGIKMWQTDDIDAYKKALEENKETEESDEAA
jgi:multicomponent Na+:H+ antiporter subunit G